MIRRLRSFSKHRRKTSLAAYGAGAVALVTAATYGTIAIASPSADAKGGTGSAFALQDDFASAAREFKVPQSVLMAVSYNQTLWDSHGGRPSATGNYNVMALTQVNPADLVTQSPSAATDELNQSGDPRRMKKFHPDKALLAKVGTVDTDDPRLHTLDEAAKLIGEPASALRTDRRQSIRGAAALLAQYEKDAYGSLPAEAGPWYAAVARYSQSTRPQGAQLFADRVFASIRSGVSRTTDDGQQVTLAAAPSVRAVKPAKVPLAATYADTAAAPTPECPSTLYCTFTPAAYKQNSTDPADYGNYDIADRPTSGPKINSIVIHDIEGTAAGAISTFQNSTAYASAHYVIAADGTVTQMIPTKDIAWHAGNKSVNQHSIGIEHEGYAIKAGSWYTESEYASSQQLLRYLTALYGIPRDREHIFGHDEVPGPLDAYVAGMHWDPGPYWDWNHLMQLIGAANGAGGAGSPLRTGQVIRVVPPFTSANQPVITYGGTTQAARPANFLYLYTQPSTGSARLGDPYLHSGTAGTTDGPDWGDKVVAGGRYVVAQQYGDWTAIWYGGQKAWFYNPGGQNTATVGTTGQTVVTPAAGLNSIPVYGRSYPESAAYATTQVPPQDENDAALTKYTIAAGQKYVPVGPPVTGDFYYAENYDGSAPGDRTTVTGTTTFYPIRFNHRLAYVKATDVQEATSTAPLSPTTRYNLVGRDSSGVVWQFQGTGNATSPFLTRFKVGSGWQGYNAVTALTALRADGTGDVAARDTAGYLWYYQGSGNPAAPFKARVKAGSGYGGYTWLGGVRDISGDGRPDLAGRDSHGNLWLFKGTGSATAPFATRVAVGTGWNNYTAIAGVGDVTADGKPDVVGRDSHGNLWLFKGTGSATAPFATRVAVGTGFNAYNALVGVSDVTGDGRPDLVGRDSTGALYLYKGTGSATAPFAARAAAGSGYGAYGLLF